jgi:hypothetical protein
MTMSPSLQEIGLMANRLPAEVPRSGRLDRPYESLSRPCLRRIIDSPDALLAFQWTVLTSSGRQQQRRDVLTPAPLFIAQGVCYVACPCGDCPFADPEWQLACCLLCGAVYRTIVVPADFAAIEAALMRRPMPINRNWQPAETYAAIVAENAANGVQ